MGVVVFSYGAYIPIKAKVAQYLIHQSWLKTNKNLHPSKPWAWMDSHPVMRLVSKKHQQDFIVLSGYTGNVLAFAPGYNANSALPSQLGTTLISAHRDTHFEFLQAVGLGDEFKIHLPSGTKEYVYRVNNLAIIDTNFQKITLSTTHSELKLVTCYPFNALVAGGSKRYVVTLNLI
jgi:sortase A